jgi:hypothetical protein
VPEVPSKSPISELFSGSAVERGATSVRLAVSGVDAGSARDAGAEYTITTRPANGEEVTVTRKASGEITRGCSGPPVRGGRPGGGPGSV